MALAVAPQSGCLRLGMLAGAGKTMLVERLPSARPPLDDDAALEVSALHSVAGLQRGSPYAPTPWSRRRGRFNAPRRGRPRRNMSLTLRKISALVLPTSPHVG
ncbi:ATP-binding protein, partial [Asanoa siamensis]|uniref:ATP-binding protein n=1 Tax=Asanoa siamensis TaxID=926357 RepID=UPI00194401E7